jgi:hypothetical protein
MIYIGGVRLIMKKTVYLFIVLDCPGKPKLYASKWS